MTPWNETLTFFARKKILAPGHFFTDENFPTNVQNGIVGKTNVQKGDDELSIYEVSEDFNQVPSYSQMYYTSFCK